MALSIGSTSSVQTNHGSATQIKTAQVAKSQQQLEGEMALKLIESANVDAVSLPTTSNSGQNINILV